MSPVFLMELDWHALHKLSDWHVVTIRPQILSIALVPPKSSSAYCDSPALRVGFLGWAVLERKHFVRCFLNGMRKGALLALSPSCGIFQNFPVVSKLRKHFNGWKYVLGGLRVWNQQNVLYKRCVEMFQGLYIHIKTLVLPCWKHGRLPSFNGFISWKRSWQLLNAVMTWSRVGPKARILCRRERMVKWLVFGF